VHWTSANGDPKLRRKSSGSTSTSGGDSGAGGTLPWGWTRSRSVIEETHEVHCFLYPLAVPTHIDSSPSEMNDPHFHSHQQEQEQEQRQEQSSRRHQAAARKQTNKEEEEEEEEDNEEAYDKFDQPLGGHGHGQGGVDVWYEQWDELNKASYYYNAATGESQWESPEWVEETDPASGARYY
jgi:hypothetical protein